MNNFMKILPAAVLPLSLLSGEPEITVSLNGSKGTLQTPFRDGYVLEQNFQEAPPQYNRQFNFGTVYLIGKDRKLRLATPGDDATPWNINSTYIGANHGDSICSRLMFQENHGLTAKDCGSEWQNANGRKFYVVKVESPKVLWVLSENLGKGDIWRFVRPQKAELKNAAGKILRGYEEKFQQFYPAVRIRERRYFADNREVSGQCTMKCTTFTVRETYDIVATDSILEHIRKNAGKSVSNIDPEVEKVLTQTIEYRFDPYGACAVTHEAEFFRDVRLGYMGFIQAAKLRPDKPFSRHIYYIPKTKPFQFKGREYDFLHGQDYREKLPATLYLTKDTYLYPDNPPDRFIQIVGGENVPDVGFVCGYAAREEDGSPLLRKNRISRAGFLYTSSKTYPYAMDGGKIPVIRKGTKLFNRAYRQYFDPTLNYYLNRQGHTLVLYMDFREPVRKKKMVLPAKLAGKKFTVLEKSPSLTLREAAPAAYEIDCPDQTSYAVLSVR